jgi:hypothetical protein
MELADTVTAVDATAKAQAALAIITEQTADVQGQFARESSTAAGAAAIICANVHGPASLPSFGAAPATVTYFSVIAM